MENVNNFGNSRRAEQFTLQHLILPAFLREPKLWHEATPLQQKEGIDFFYVCKGRRISVELKTETYNKNLFLELLQFVDQAGESEGLAQFGYFQKCRADLLVLSNVPGRFAVVVPRKQFLEHAWTVVMDLRSRGKVLDGAINTSKGQVTRTGIGIPVAFQECLTSFKGAWAFVNLSSKTLKDATEELLLERCKTADRVETELQRGDEIRGVINTLKGCSNHTLYIHVAVRVVASLMTDFDAPPVQLGLIELMEWAREGINVRANAHKFIPQVSGKVYRPDSPLLGSEPIIGKCFAIQAYQPPLAA